MINKDIAYRELKGGIWLILHVCIYRKSKNKELDKTKTLIVTLRMNDAKYKNKLFCYLLRVVHFYLAVVTTSIYFLFNKKHYCSLS